MPATGRRASRGSTWHGVRSFVTERFPAALYRLRWWWIGYRRGQRGRDRRDDGVAARPPERRAEPALARATSTSWSTTTSTATTASTPPPTSPPRSGPTTPGWPRSASRSACSGCPVIYLLFQNIANLAIIGSIMIRHDHGGRVLGADPPARAARADRRLRRRRGRAAAVLVVGRAGRPDPCAVLRPRGPHRRHRRARPGRRAGGQWRHRGVRDARARCRPGPGSRSASSPRWPSSPTSSCSAARRSAAATTGDIDPLLLEDRVATQA